MKKLICMVLVALVAVSALAGCTGSFDKSPDQFEKIRWITPDYSFSIYPDDDCKGKYVFAEKTYEFKAVFENNRVKFLSVSGDKELFHGNWNYDKNDRLFIYGIVYNTGDFKEFSDNYNEFYTLKKEKI